MSEMTDLLEVLDTTIEIENLRGWLVEEFGYGDGFKGGSPPFDPVSTFSVLNKDHRTGPG